MLINVGFDQDVPPRLFWLLACLAKSGPNVAAVAFIESVTQQLEVAIRCSTLLHDVEMVLTGRTLKLLVEQTSPGVGDLDLLLFFLDAQWCGELTTFMMDERGNGAPATPRTLHHSTTSMRKRRSSTR